MRKHHIVGAWLSLFAMLMIFAGPLISQGISLARGQSQQMSMAGMDCHDMPGMSQMSDHSSDDKHHDLIMWEKCGYCSLLFQHPPLTESNLLSAQLDAPAPSHLSVLFITQRAQPPVFPGSRSRAPPIQPLNVTVTFC